MRVDGFGLAGYRSSGENLQMIYPKADINIVIGPNNSGKSNLLRFIAEKYISAVTAVGNSTSFSLDDADHHLEKRDIFRFHCPRTFVNQPAVSDNFVLEKMRKLESQLSRPGERVVHTECELLPNGHLGYSSRYLQEVRKTLVDSDWGELSMKLTKGREDIHSDIRSVLNTLFKRLPAYENKVIFVPDIREIGRQTKKTGIPYDIVDGGESDNRNGRSDLVVSNLEHLK